MFIKTNQSPLQVFLWRGLLCPFDAFAWEQKKISDFLCISLTYS